MAEQYFLGSLAAHKDFIEGVLWQDYQREVNAWLEGVRDQLEIETDPGGARHLQGVAEACRKFLVLPHQVIEVLTLAMEK